MRQNDGVTIEGKTCSLVPYIREHVAEYHSWFVEDPELLELTCSELLSIDEEYENCDSWRNDPNKLTFLLRDSARSGILCGDINCFLAEYDPDEFDAPGEGVTGEINLMVALQASRGKGIASEALSLLEDYVRTISPSTRLFIAKITLGNTKSIGLFEKSGYRVHKRVECFNEVHYIKWIS
jgi:RimJ/RimL family protein N-acetyltransferase